MKSLFEAAHHCLKQTNIEAKMQLSLEYYSVWKAGQLDYKNSFELETDFLVGIPEKPQLVEFKDLARRGWNTLEQRATLIHALAHIEFTAVNLSWDTIYRFQGMPKAYYQDWIDTAADETRHFLALRKELQDMGFDYGDFSAHNALWLHAISTQTDLKHRLAIVHRTLEARAIDAIPQAVKRFEKIKSFKTARLLNELANDEIKHVSAATRWFDHQCKQDKLDSFDTYFELVLRFLKTYPKGPFNVEARRLAGFSERELHFLQQHAPNKKR